MPRAFSTRRFTFTYALVVAVLVALAANLLGSFAIGFLAVWLEGRGPQALYWRAFLIVGVLGGLTTFSALMVETLLIARSQRSDLLLGYLGGTLVAGFVLVWAGARLAAMLRPAY